MRIDLEKLKKHGYHVEALDGDRRPTEYSADIKSVEIVGEQWLRHDGQSYPEWFADQVHQEFSLTKEQTGSVIQLVQEFQIWNILKS